MTIQSESENVMPYDKWLQIRLYRELHKRFLETAHRERRSASDILREFIEDYLRKHEHGNPQMPMDPFFEPREPGTQVRLCDNCPRPAAYIVFLWISDENHQTQYLCAVHFQEVCKKSWHQIGWRDL